MMKTDRNKLLASLSPDVLERLLPHFEEVDLVTGEQAHGPGSPLKFLYFPLSGLISLLLLLEDGRTGEIAMVGREGLIGGALLLSGTLPATIQSQVQAAGTALRLPVEPAAREFQKCTAFHDLVLRYTQTLTMQVAQTALCNRHHSLEQQLARWLLLGMDRLECDQMVLTQEILAHMLGVRREGVSAAARRLQERGLINYRRGQIKVLDREKLVQHACECYRAINAEYVRNLPPVA